MNILHGTILLVIAFLELLLGIYILVQNPKEEIRRWYSLFILGVVIWVGCNGLLLFTQNSNIALFYTNITFIGATLIATSFLFFSWTYPIRTIKTGLLYWIIFLLPIIIFSYLALSSTFPIENEPVEGKFGWDEVIGPAFPYFAIFFLFYWAWALYNLIKKYRTLDGIHKWQLKNLFWAIGISSAIGITLGLIFPWVGLVSYSWLGAESTIIWLGFMSYILFKKNVGERG